MKSAQLKAIAKDMNRVMGLEPPITVKVGVSNEDLLEGISTGASLIEPPDLKSLSDDTVDLLKELAVDEDFLATDKGEEAVKVLTKLEVLTEEEPEPEEKPAKTSRRKPAKKEEEEPEPEEKPAKKSVDKKKPAKKEGDGKNEFGHRIGTFSDAIDQLMLSKKAYSAEEIIKKTGCKPYKVKAHITHLIEVCDVDIVEKDGKFKMK